MTAIALTTGGLVATASADPYDPCAAGSSVSVPTPTEAQSGKLRAYAECRDGQAHYRLLGHRVPGWVWNVWYHWWWKKRMQPAPTPTQSLTTSPKPTPTTTTTPTSTPPDGFPNAGNTGVPAGTSLSSYSGPLTITANGTVIDSKKITGCLLIKADDVTIKNSLVQSSCFYNVLNDDGKTGLKLVDVEIDGLNNGSGNSAIGGYNYSCLRCDIHSVMDGFKAGDDVVIQDSYIHDLTMTSDSHNDGIQSLGTDSLKIIHNTIIAGTGSTSAIILSTGVASEMKNISIDGNLLGGGAYTVYGGYQAGTDVRSRVANIAITNNRFTTQIYPKGGAYGPLTSVSSPVVVSGNRWHDGPDADAPIG